MKRSLRKGLLYLMAGFVALFLARLAYGYLTPVEQARILAGDAGFALMSSIGGRDTAVGVANAESFASLKENFASEKLKVQRDFNSVVADVDQK